ncbi:MAG: DMT family transporter [Saprospiraceae bacterium]|nr:DMT family transporter [Saprospiraceae bacterium]
MAKNSYCWLAANGGNYGAFISFDAVLWYVALSRERAAKASSFLFLTPLFTVITSVLVLKTTVSWQQLIGALLVGAALYIVNRVVTKKLENS